MVYRFCAGWSLHPVCCTGNKKVPGKVKIPRPGVFHITAVQTQVVFQYRLSSSESITWLAGKSRFLNDGGRFARPVIAAFYSQLQNSGLIQYR
jgi:hypothetical protein